MFLLMCAGRVWQELMAQMEQRATEIMRPGAIIITLTNRFQNEQAWALLVGGLHGLPGLPGLPLLLVLHADFLAH
ncbi:hypothetical protein CYMTET_3216 [Cymbomonas tetramitiformis]|uniref:Uncharacterized protein n=1 Tax=Cymbomonas tetramitiformis TaxID=36881 RepID=A0AAE0H3R0_9CHLO|nr:hypothetical protein CYMTET_3216 [Cymbomonas tetramitiformis]